MLFCVYLQEEGWDMTMLLEEEPMVEQPKVIGRVHHRALRAILEDIAEAAITPMSLADLVSATLRTGYRHRGKRSLSQVVQYVLRRLVEEGSFDFDEENRQYEMCCCHRKRRAC